MSWTIQTPSADGTFDAYYIYGAKRSLKSATKDTFTFTQLTDVTNSPVCVYGDSVTVWNNGTAWFSGICTKAIAGGEPGNESWKIEISGGWYWLDVMVMQMNWGATLAIGASYQCGRIIIGYVLEEVGGSEVVVYSSIAQTIQSVFAWAVSCGCQIQLGACNIPAFTYPMEMVDATCGEIIRRQLKYAPDVVSWTDYSTSPPTINFESRFTLPARTLAYTAFGDKGFTCQPRPDLIPPQICICYELTNTIDGTPVIDVSYDAVPANAKGNAPRSLVMTIPLHGVKEVYAKQRLRVQPIPLNFDEASDDPETLQTLGRFYQQFVSQFLLADSVAGDANTPDLKFYPLEGSSGPYYEITLAKPDGVNGDGDPFVYSDPTNTSSTQLGLDTSLQNCLLEGDIMPWMEPSTYAQVQTITFRASWTITDSSGNVQQCGIDPLEGTPGILCYATLTATNGISQTYHDLQSYEGGEQVPTGLAAALSASLSTLQYEGSATMVEDEVSGAMALGQTLNVTGARAEWAAMIALIQTLEEDIDKGISTAKFGPANHLNIQDVIEMLRMNRPADADTRAGGANAQPMLTGLM